MRIHRIQKSPFGAVFAVLWIDPSGKKRIVDYRKGLPRALELCRELDDLSARASRLGLEIV